MEWYDWVFAICASGMAVVTVLVAPDIYDALRHRKPRGGAGPRPGR